MPNDCDLGLIGLAVMGQNLVLNMADRGFKIAAYNRTTDTMREFVAGPASGKSIVGCETLEEFVASLARPRRAMVMVKAGRPVDAVIDQLVPLLEEGDIIIDGGNSLFTDTARRQEQLSAKGIRFLGAGISGGEEGARHGPSIMPGGDPEAWPSVRPIFQAIAAKVGPNDDIPCCDWVGPGGSGHYVKMVHNGIEYGDMQVICEAYHLLASVAGMDAGELYDTFDAWNRTELDSYLIEITRDIFSVQDEATGRPLVDLVLDKAQQKGTGKWTSQDALDLGVPLTLISEAVFARCLSAQKDERVRASSVLPAPGAAIDGFREGLDRAGFVEDVRKALYASKICSYAQGFVQLRYASAEHGWGLNLGDTAMLWRGGCIIRAAFLERIKEAFDRDPDLPNLLVDPYFIGAMEDCQDSWRRVVAACATLGIPAPAFSSALSYYDGYRAERLPHNLLQSQRDYFGAHTYERVDGEGSHHSEWMALRRDPVG